MNNNSSIKNFNFQEDSKISSIVNNVVNTSPSTSVNKNFNSSITPPHELNSTEKVKEINHTRDFNLKQKIASYTNNLSKSSKSPYNKDKFLKHIKAASNNINTANNNLNKNSNIFNNNINNNDLNNDNNQNLNAKSLSIISENSTIKRKIFQNNYLVQSKGEKSNFSIKENYKSENDFINNINNINRTKTPNTRSLNRDFSENVIYSNKIKPKNNLNYTNRETTLNILSDRDRKQTGSNNNNSNTINIPNQLNHNNTLSNLNRNTNQSSSNNNLEKKQTANFNYGVKNAGIHHTPHGNNSNFNNSTKNNSAGGVYQFKANPLYNNSIINKSLNGNLNNNSITINSNNANNVKDLLGNNMNLSLNLHSKNIFFTLIKKNLFLEEFVKIK